MGQNRMRVLVAYDGSVYAEAALAGLGRAGLPRATSILVVTASEVAPPGPPLSPSEATETVLVSGKVATALAKAYERAMKARGDSYLLALAASLRVRAMQPAWEVTAEALVGTPSDEIVRRAEEWRAGLVVVGTHGRSALGRIVLGSVSNKVAAEARCSVRVARGGAGENEAARIRLLIGLDVSAGAGRAVRVVSERAWPDGTEARVVAVHQHKGPATASSPPSAAAVAPGGGDEDTQMRTRSMVEWAQQELRSRGLKVETEITSGDPSAVLLEEASRWGAYCVFVGARGADRAPDEPGIGRVAAGLVTKASCSVEVVRHVTPAG